MSRRSRGIAAQTRVELMMTLRRGESLMVTLAIPVGILVFFGKVDALSAVKGDPIAFLVPGVLALAVMANAMVSLGIATGFERRYGVLKRLGSTPLSRSGLLAAKTAQVLIVEVIQAAVIVGTAFALGWHTGPSLGAAVVLLLLGTVAFAGIGMLMAGTLRAEANLAAANGLFLVLMFLGGMAYPLAKLPNAVETIAKLLPAAALSECVRAVLRSDTVPTGALVVLLVWTVATPLAAARWFRWEER
ncbi:MAG: ABC transporter permease [Acidimicrobiia bacterium]